VGENPTVIEERRMRIGVIGTGHVGLVAATCLAEMGHEVIASDRDIETIENLAGGVAPFYEPGLEPLLGRHSATGRLAFSPHTRDAVDGAEVVFVCVGTPARASGEASLVAVERAVRDVARYASHGLILVQKSTVPAGTATRAQRAIAIQDGDAGRIEVVSNPEFLREGRAIEDFLNPDRILVGAGSSRAFRVMRSVYRPLMDRGCIYIETDIRTAELAKHATNAFLAMKISYANALARVCELAGADVVSVAGIMGSDPRIGRDFLDAGLGYGGFCFPKDVQGFERLAAQLGYDFALLREVRRINDEAVDATFEKVRDGLWNVEDKTVALLGLAFKPGTDDVRFAPALSLARRLISEGARVAGYDPVASENAKRDVPQLEVAASPYDAAAGAHCVVLCTEWPEFQQLDLDKLRSVMTYALAVDARNVLDQEAMRNAGFTLYPTGRPGPVMPSADRSSGTGSTGLRDAGLERAG
jgi:UDPglucose 6-dehydrogenase